MRKAVIVKVFVGSLLGFLGAVVLFLAAGGLALSSDSFIMNGPDVVGISADPFAWWMVGLASVAVLMMGTAAVGLLIAWIGAAVNTANLPDKTWFIVLLAGGLLGLGSIVTLVYVVAGPEGQPTAVQAGDAPIPPRDSSSASLAARDLPRTGTGLRPSVTTPPRHEMPAAFLTAADQ